MELDLIENFKDVADFHLRQLQKVQEKVQEKVSKRRNNLQEDELLEEFKDSFAEAFGVLWTAAHGSLPTTFTFVLNENNEELCIHFKEENRLVLEGVVLDGFLNKNQEVKEKIGEIAKTLISMILNRFDLELLEENCERQTSP